MSFHVAVVHSFTLLYSTPWYATTQLFVILKSVAINILDPLPGSR